MRILLCTVLILATRPALANQDSEAVEAVATFLRLQEGATKVLDGKTKSLWARNCRLVADIKEKSVFVSLFSSGFIDQAASIQFSESGNADETEVTNVTSLTSRSEMVEVAFKSRILINGIERENRISLSRMNGSLLVSLGFQGITYKRNHGEMTCQF